MARRMMIVRKKVMIQISSSVYKLLLERSSEFQSKLHSSSSSKSTQSFASSVDGDDVYVYLRFGGGALCGMLHQRYEQIKNCPEMQRNSLSKEISLLQAIKMTDKSQLPPYHMYRDSGYMYFPDVTFIPFLKSVGQVVKKCHKHRYNTRQWLGKICGSCTLNLYCVFQTAHEKVQEQDSLKESFLQILAGRLPNVHAFSEEAVNTVYNVLVCKLCNTHVQEVVSTVKQQLEGVEERACFYNRHKFASNFVGESHQTWN